MIIIYGGAFNPPTKAHYEIAKMLIDKFNPDTFYFLPVGEKYNKKGMETFNNRFNMTQIMANKLVKALVSTKENEPKFRGTYYMLKDFSEIDKDLYFVMGADNFDYLDNWIMAENLIAEFKFIILSRRGYDVDKLIKEKYSKYKENFTVINIDLPISSTEFRNYKDKEILIEEVYKYIVENNLYEVKDNA
jgi:nicotinate-nucleotide adenylyltransferase